MKKANRQQNRITRHKRLRSHLSGVSTVPRISFFKSNKHIFVQAIDDATGKTIASITDINSKSSGTKTETSNKLGQDFAGKIASLGIKKVVFDRGGHKYHGRVKAFADAMRSKSIEF